MLDQQKIQTKNLFWNKKIPTKRIRSKWSNRITTTEYKNAKETEKIWNKKKNEMNKN